MMVMELTSSTCLFPPLSSTCHFQPDSGPVYNRLLPVSRLLNSTLPTVSLKAARSKRLLSKSPRYVVLARTATETIVYMGCRHARPDIANRKGLICRPSQLEECADLFKPRQREGKKDAPSMMHRIREELILWGTTGAPTGSRA